MIEILQLNALKDNYIYILHEPHSDETIVIDPSDADIVLQTLNDRDWNLTYVLNTHHHSDHVSGNSRLKSVTGCCVIGMFKDRDRIPGVDVLVHEGDRFSIGDSSFLVLEVPGHTSGHLAFWFPTEGILFCGDSLFSLGCGRLFEGSAEEMWLSLDKLRSLPSSTRIYCAHEYTLSNGIFALSAEPDNLELQKRIMLVKELRKKGLPTIPVLLADELLTNPFLRPESPQIRNRLGLSSVENWIVFSELRRLKDLFAA